MTNKEEGMLYTNPTCDVKLFFSRLYSNSLRMITGRGMEFP